MFGSIWAIQHDVPVAEVARDLIEIFPDDGDELGVSLGERITGES